MQQYSLMFCAIQRKFVVKSFSLSIYYTLVKLRNQVAKECFKARKDLINWIWEELRTMGIMFLLRDWLAASWHELPLAIDYCTNPKIRVKCAKQENKNKSLQLRWSPNELDHQNHVFPMEMNVFDLSVEQLNLAVLQRLIVIITRWKIIVFFSFDRIFLIIHQFERLPLHVFTIVPTLHVLKLKKYIHLLWMANTYIYVRTHVFMHAWQHSEWFVKLIRHWLQPEKSRMNCGTNVAYTAQKNIQMKSSLARVCFSNTKWRNGSAIAAISSIVLILFELNASFVHCLRLNLTQFSVLTLLSF